MSSTAWLHALLRHSQTRIVAAAASVTALVSTCSAVTPQTVWLEGGEDSGSSGSTTVSLGHRQRYASKQFRGRAVIIRPAEFAMKRRKLIAGGASKLQVIADFDRTMTSCFITDAEGTRRRGVSAHGVLERCPRFTQSYHAAARALFHKYHPLEISPDMTIEEKIPLMLEWYTQGHNLLMKQGLRKSYIVEAVEAARKTPLVVLRNGCPELVHRLAQANVPLLVLSAGLGDVLEEIMTQYLGPLPSNTHIISNKMVFDDTGLLVGFSEPLIHMFNKNENHQPDASYYEATHARRNVILLGDSMGDHHMADGVETDTMLAIGFLNEKIAESWDAYAARFDVLIVGDGDMSFVNALLGDIITGRAPTADRR